MHVHLTRVVRTELECLGLCRGHGLTCQPIQVSCLTAVANSERKRIAIRPGSCLPSLKGRLVVAGTCDKRVRASVPFGGRWAEGSMICWRSSRESWTERPCARVSTQEKPSTTQMQEIDMEGNEKADAFAKPGAGCGWRTNDSGSSIDHQTNGGKCLFPSSLRRIFMPSTTPKLWTTGSPYKL